MMLGSRPLGSRSFGDSAGHILETFTPDVTGTASLTFGGMTLTGDTYIVRTGTASLPFGGLRFGTAASPGGGSAGGSVDVISFREITLPFEYTNRWADLYVDLGFSVEQAEILEQRDRELEEYLQVAMPDLIFSLPGPLYESISPKYRSRSTYRVDQWIASLNEAGSTTTTAWVLVSGTRRIELEFGVGVTEVTVDRYVLLEKDVDYVQVELVTPGTGASGLSVQGVLRR